MTGPDPRFYESFVPLAAKDLADLVGGELGDCSHGERRIAQAASLVDAGGESLCYCADRRRAEEVARTDAAACILPRALAVFAPRSCAVVIHPFPGAAFAAAVERLHRIRRHDWGEPAIHGDAEVGQGARLAPAVVVGPRARLGRDCLVGSGAVIGPGVSIGANSSIGAGARIHCALIGERVRVLAGAIIGEAGFGSAVGPSGLVDLPQLGRVIVRDGVTVGAGSCIDRGTFGDTVIGENTKIDNLVQVGHNVVIGRDCVLAAHTGISGSVTIGDNCMFGGRAGIADHLVIGDGARIAAASGLMHDVPAGESWGGIPARPVRRWFREMSALAKLAGRGSWRKGRAGDDRG